MCGNKFFALLFLQRLYSLFHFIPIFYLQLNYLPQGGNVFVRLCLFVCLCVSKISQKVMDGSF